MLLIDTYLAPSSIQGVGMFTRNFVAQGTLVWKFDQNFDRVYTPEAYGSLPARAQRFLQTNGFFTEGGLWVISGDDDKYVNHAEDPNLVEVQYPDPVTRPLVACRDIAAGEELTENYKQWDKVVGLKGLP